MVYTLWVRFTHWLNALTLGALLFSGTAILIAHPRFYWGDAGYFDTPAAFELPIIPDMDHTGWGRSLHFLAAWIFVLNGLVYVLWGILRRHFRETFVPRFADLHWSEVSAAFQQHFHLRLPPGASHYNLFQKCSYLAVVFVLPLIAILTGLTMSPAFTSAFPQLFSLFGGRQSARSIHFFAATALLAFLVVHVTMVMLTGWRGNLKSMIKGSRP